MITDAIDSNLSSVWLYSNDSGSCQEMIKRNSTEGKWFNGGGQFMVMAVGGPRNHD